MTQDKNTTVSWLYTVRACLSAISIERDRAAELEENFEKKKLEEKKKLVQTYGENVSVEFVKAYDEGFDPSKCSVGGIEREENYRTAVQQFDAEKLRLQAKNEEHSKSFKKIIYILLGITLAAVGLIFLIVGALSDDYSLYVIGGVALLAGGAFSLTYGFCGPSKAFKEESKALREALAVTEKNIAACARLKSVCLEYENEKNRGIDEIVSGADKLYDKLAEIIGGALDPRDWKYVDLLIYYFETNRAETIREALQLIDRELQTQAIIGSVAASTRQICNVIRTESDRLNNMISQCFKEMNENLKNVQSLQYAQVLEQDMNNALLKKAAASSEQLANDVAYLRNRKR